jgi:hypothetical protein
MVLVKDAYDLQMNLYPNDPKTFDYTFDDVKAV